MKLRMFAFLIFVLMISCQKDDVENTGASILKMSFDFGEVVFDGNEGTVKAPENTDLKKLIPTIEISEGAVVYPPSKAITDYTEPVDYSVISEDQESTTYYTVSVHLPIVSFTVYDCTAGTVEYPFPELAPDTKISIFTDVNGEKVLVEELTTDENSNAYLYGYRKNTFYFTAEKNGAVNIIDGFAVNGIFENQEDIDNSPLQSQSSQVGDLKFMDINQDGLVNADDKVDYFRIWNIPETEIKEVDVYIAQE